MNVSKHGEIRLRKRLGKSKSSVENIFDKALSEGKKQHEFKGAFKRYLDWIAFQQHCTPLVYQGTIFITTKGKLITAWQIPHRYVKYVKEAK